MSLRVAFAGGSGTGKTTMTRLVSEVWGLPINPVGSRSVAREMGFASPYDVDAAGKRAEFQARLLAEKVAWEAEHDAFVSDRTVADNLAYLALHDVLAIDDATIATVGAAMGRYTHVFFCPVDAFCDPGGDPMRVASLAYHRVFEAVLTGLFSTFDRDVEVVSAPAMVARDRYLRSVLGWPPPR